MSTRVLALACIIMAAGCGGEDDTPPAPAAPPPVTTDPPGPPGSQPSPAPAGTPEAKRFFVEEVYPSLSQTCGTCHIGGQRDAPLWLGGDANTAYDQIKAYKNGLLVGPAEANLLILKEPHQGGQELSGPQKGLVEQWLVLEYGDIGAAPGITFSQALENFAGCMNFQDWVARGLDQLPLVPVNVDGVDVLDANCETCHLDADLAGGVLLNANDAQGTFDNFRIFPGIMKLVTGRGFPFQQLGDSRRLIDKGGEDNSCVVDNALLELVQDGNLNDPNYCHPNYDVDNDAEDQLEFFVNNTAAVSKAGNCVNQGQ